MKNAQHQNRKSFKKWALTGQLVGYDSSFARRKYNEAHPRKDYIGVKALRPLFRVFVGRCMA